MNILHCHQGYKPEWKICGGCKEIMVYMSTLNDLICCGLNFLLDAASSLFSIFFF